MRFTKGHGEDRGHLDCDGQVHEEGPAKAGWSGIRSPRTQVHGVSGSPAQTPAPLGSPASAPVIHFPCASEESFKITNQILSLPCSEHFRGSLAHADKIQTPHHGLCSPTKRAFVTSLFPCPLTQSFCSSDTPGTIPTCGPLHWLSPLPGYSPSCVYITPTVIFFRSLPDCFLARPVLKHNNPLYSPASFNFLQKKNLYYLLTSWKLCT